MLAYVGSGLDSVISDEACFGLFLLMLAPKAHAISGVKGGSDNNECC